jgi:TPR repeat protein
MYANGEGVPEDIVQAFAWWNLAAAAGDEGASVGQLGMRQV